MKQATDAKLISGPVGKTMIRLTGPMIIGVLGAVLFNIVDTIFIGQLGAAELAAMGFIFPVVMIVGGTAIGLGIGASAVISRAIGEGDYGQVRRLTTDSLVLSTLIVAIFVAAGLLTIKPIFSAMGASDEILGHIRSYMLIWYPGMVFLVIPMVGNNAIRATGDTKTPGFVMLFAFTINLILDPLLIFGYGPFPRLELAGAAIATIIARAVTLVVSLHILVHREKMITFKHPKIHDVLLSWKRILYIGLPTAATNIIRPLGIGIVTKMVSIYGPAAVAALGVASRIDAFALVTIMALSSVQGPFIGQNLGAKKYGRIHLAIKINQRFAMLWGFIVFLIVVAFAHPIAAIFNDNADVISIIKLYLYIVAIGYGLFGVYALTNSAFNVLNKPFYGNALTLIQIFVLLIPLAWAGSQLAGLKGIFTGILLAGGITGVIGYLWLRLFLKKHLPIAGEDV